MFYVFCCWYFQYLFVGFCVVVFVGWLSVVVGVEVDILVEGIGKNIKYVFYSDIGGRLDSVQVMFNCGYVYVGYMFSDGVMILDVLDLWVLKLVNFFIVG